MSVAETLLRSHYQRRRLLRSFYDELRVESKTQVEQLAALNNTLVLEDESFPNLDFRFFEIDAVSSTHFRIVAALGIVVFVLHEAEGVIGSLIHLHNDGDLCDISCVYVVETGTEAAIRARIDKYERRVVERVGEAVEATLGELITPTISPSRLRATPEQPS